MLIRPSNRDELLRSLVAASSQGTRIDQFDLSAFSRLLEYTPEDLTVTVEAGLTLGALQNALRERGQWLPVDPPHADSLTIGALLAVNASGPRRFGHGTIRDHLLGLQVALADGRLIRSGGKVVKNVAGFDLLKLFVGSHGSLGVITEATFKLLPLPEAEHTVQQDCATLTEAGAVLERVLASELTPVVLDLHRPGKADASRLTLTFSGAREDVEAQLDSAVDLGFIMAGTLDYNAAFHASGLPKPQRASVLPSRLVPTLESLAPESFVARAGNGVIHYRGGSDAPRAELPNALLLGIKNTFDPKGILPDMPT